MNRKLFLTIASIIAISVGGFSLMAPDVLLTSVKVAVSNPATLVMAQTVGVFLLAMGFMGFLIRGHVDSPTMEVFLKANLFLQLSLIPIDPLAYMNGTFTTFGSFVPNTIIHILLAVGFAYHLIKVRKTLAAQSPMANGS